MNRILQYIDYNEVQNGLYLCEDIERIGTLLFGALKLSGPILHISETNYNCILYSDGRTDVRNVSQYIKYNTGRATISKRESIEKASFGYNICIGFYVEYDSLHKRYSTLSHLRTLDMCKKEKQEILACYQELANEAMQLGLKNIKIQIVGSVASYFNYEKEYNYHYFISKIEQIFVDMFGDHGFIDQPEMKETGFEHYVSDQDILFHIRKTL